MNEKIMEEIKKEQEKALQKFESAKAEAIETLKNMQVHTAVDFGAGYASHIDKITAAAAEVKKCAEILSMMEYFSRKAQEETPETCTKRIPCSSCAERGTCWWTNK